MPLWFYLRSISIGLKFSGRTDSRGARFLHGAPGGRRALAPSGVRAALMTAAASGVLLVLTALLRHFLGAPQTATFSAIFFTPLLASARFAGQAFPSTALWLAGVILLLGAGAQILATAWNRRGLDAILCALVAFQIFWLARYVNPFLPPAGPLAWSTLSLAQRLNIGWGMILVFSLLTARACGAKARSRYEGSAPSRITRFLKKRRLRSQTAGAVLMAVAIIVIFGAARLAWMEGNPTLAPTLAFAVFLVADALYLAGRKLWTRLN